MWGPLAKEQSSRFTDACGAEGRGRWELAAGAGGAERKGRGGETGILGLARCVRGDPCAPKGWGDIMAQDSEAVTPRLRPGACQPQGSGFNPKGALKGRSYSSGQMHVVRPGVRACALE